MSQRSKPREYRWRTSVICRSSQRIWTFSSRDGSTACGTGSPPGVMDGDPCSHVQSGAGLGLELPEVALEGAQVVLLVAEDVDHHVLRRPVDTVAGLDDAVVVLDRAGLGLDDATDDADDVGRITRLQRRLLVHHVERAGGRAVEVLDATGELARV